MKYVKDLCGSGQVPVCIDCICATCAEPCSSCPKETDNGTCVKCECVMLSAS